MAEQVKALRRRFNAALGDEERSARQARTDLAGFDPQEAFDKSTQASFRFVEKDLRRNLEALRGSQVATGRLRTGFASTDEDRLFRDTIDDFGARVAQQGVNVNQQRLGKLGLQNQSRDRFLELLTAGQDRAQAEKEARFGFDDFLQTAGTAAKFIPFL